MVWSIVKHYCKFKLAAVFTFLAILDEQKILFRNALSLPFNGYPKYRCIMQITIEYKRWSSSADGSQKWVNCDKMNLQALSVVILVISLVQVHAIYEDIISDILNSLGFETSDSVEDDNVTIAAEDKPINSE